MAEFLHQAWPYAAAVLVILAAVALIALIVVLVRAAKSMKHINEITSVANDEVVPALKRVDPIVDRVELTVDTLNLELLRVDSILEDVEQVTDVAGRTADTVNAITSAPTNAVASLAEKIRGKLGSHRRAKAKESRVVYPLGAAGEQAGKHSIPAADGTPVKGEGTPADTPAEAGTDAAADSEQAADAADKPAAAPEAPAAEASPEQAE